MNKIYYGTFGCFKNQDIYGQPINLNFNGEKTFKTVPGGLISILFMLLMLLYSVFKFKDMVELKNWGITQQVVVADLSDLKKEYPLKPMTNITTGFQMTLKKEKQKPWNILNLEEEAPEKSKDEIYQEACEVVNQFIYVQGMFELKERFNYKTYKDTN